MHVPSFLSATYVCGSQCVVSSDNPSRHANTVSVFSFYLYSVGYREFSNNRSEVEKELLVDDGGTCEV